MLTPDEVRDALARAERRFVEACLGANDAQWQFKPDGQGDRAWTMPQIVEHVTDANHRILRTLDRVVIASPLGDRRPDYEDDDMPYLFYGGGGAPPPGFLSEPKGDVSDPAESVEAFEASMRAITSWLDAVDVDLRGCAHEHPAFGLFDGMQWLLFVVVHTRQHRGQVLDLVRASGLAPVAGGPGSLQANHHE